MVNSRSRSPGEAGEERRDELQEIEHAALLDEWKSRAAHERAESMERWKLREARRDARATVEDGLRAAVHNAYLEVAKHGIDRGLRRANFVTAGAATIATTYTGLLALVFSTKGEQAAPMPPTGMGPPLFLGLALVLSITYVAFLTESGGSGRHLPTNITPHHQEVRLMIFLNWVSQGALRRSWALRLSIWNLGVGVALMPLPFLAISQAAQWRLIGTGGALVGLAGIAETCLAARKRQRLKDLKLDSDRAIGRGIPRSSGS